MNIKQIDSFAIISKDSDLIAAKSAINIAKKLKIAWDIGNGAVGVVIDKFINNMINDTIDKW